jgi:hypothetical protein
MTTWSQVTNRALSAADAIVRHNRERFGHDRLNHRHVETDHRDSIDASRVHRTMETATRNDQR